MWKFFFFKKKGYYFLYPKRYYVIQVTFSHSEMIETTNTILAPSKYSRHELGNFVRSYRVICNIGNIGTLNIFPTNWITWVSVTNFLILCSSFINFSPPLTSIDVFSWSSFLGGYFRSMKMNEVLPSLSSMLTRSLAQITTRVMKLLRVWGIIVYDNTLWEEHSQRRKNWFNRGRDPFTYLPWSLTKHWWPIRLHASLTPLSGGITICMHIY